MDLARHVLSDANSATVRNWRVGRDTANEMIWPHRQNYHAAYDPSRQTLSMYAEPSLSRLSARPTAARCRSGEHNTDAVKTTALGGVGTLRPVRTAAADAAHRTSILESNPRNSQRSLQRSMPTAMLRPFNSAKVAVCAYSFVNASSFANASCTFPYTSQLE